MLLLFFGLMIFSGCQKDSGKSKVPEIIFTGLTGTEMRSGSSEDSIGIRFTLIDGDADLPGQDENGVYIYSKKKPTFVGHPYPPIPEQMLDPKNGIEAQITLWVKAAFYIDSTGVPDTFNFDLYVVDAAGHMSNVITTADVVLLPE